MQDAAAPAGSCPPATCPGPGGHAPSYAPWSARWPCLEAADEREQTQGRQAIRQDEGSWVRAQTYPPGVCQGPSMSPSLALQAGGWVLMTRRRRKRSLGEVVTRPRPQKGQRRARGQVRRAQARPAELRCNLGARTAR